MKNLSSKDKRPWESKVFFPDVGNGGFFQVYLKTYFQGGK